ncbi:MAG: PAS domain S-box protein [Planctomycetota bacterium]
MGQPSNRIKRFTKGFRTPVLWTLVLALFAIGAMLFSTFQVHDTWVARGERINELVEAELDVSRAYILTTESLANDKSPDPDTIASRLDRARAEIRPAGLYAEEKGKGKSAFDTETTDLTDRAQTTLAGLREFRELAMQMAQTQFSADSDTWQAFNAAYHSLLDDIDIMSAAEQNRASQTFYNHRIVEISLIGVVFLLSVGLAFFMSRHETEHARTKESLREEEEELRTTLHSIGIGLITTDTDDHIARMNPVAAGLTGWKPKDAIGQPLRQVFNIVDTDTGETPIDPVADILVTDSPAEPDRGTCLVTRDGSRHRIAHCTTPIRQDDGQQRGVVILFRDVTEEHQQQQELKHRAAFERLIINISSDFVGTKLDDLNYLIDDSLARIGQFTGADRAYVFAMRDKGTRMDNTHEWCAEGIEPEYDHLQDLPASAFSWWTSQLEEGNTVHLASLDDLPPEASETKKLLEAQDIQSLITVPMMLGDRLIGFLGFDAVRKPKEWTENDRDLLRTVGNIFAQARDRVRTQEDLQKSERKFRKIFNHANDAIYLLKITEDGLPGRFVEVNDVACERLGYTRRDFANMTPLDIDSDEDKEPKKAVVQKMLEDGETAFEVKHDTKDGSTITVEINAHPIDIDGEMHVLSIARDITQRKRAEEERLKTQKLESLGTVAGGIAHDFNNMLMGVFGNIELAQMELPESHNASSFLKDAHGALQQARNLTSQLLTFARGGSPILDTVNIRRVIRDTVKFNLRGSKIKAHCDVPENLHDVEADEGQIGQVISQLTINSKQAMPEGGNIYVDATNVSDPDPNEQHGLSGDYVRISIRDEGPGIPEECRDQIFDPYFTTKDDATGLGLAIAHSIVDQHGGRLEIESSSENGTTMAALLPAKKPVEPSPADATPEREEETEAPGSHRVLLMDDEKLIRKIGTEMIESCGYCVDTAGDGEEALNKYKTALNTTRPYDAVILDLTIPGGMGGQETAEKLLDLNPDAALIVSSGYSSDPIIANYREYGFAGRLPKPFKFKDLQKELSRIINQSV